MSKNILLILSAILIISCKPTDDTAKDLSDKPNIIYILSDDHRYDFMGFTGKVLFLETPNMDRMAREGVHFQNAFVTTALCSPSRASILTGQYTHRHGVVDNQSLVPEGTTFFPKYLQEGGYRTGYIGKWHMGEHNDNPRPGFDYWASFRGQGHYWNSVFNVNGTREEISDSTYVTHAITKYAKDFLDSRNEGEPFFLYISHKAVHAEFIPAPEHDGKYDDNEVSYPPTMFPPGHEKSTVTEGEYNYSDVPEWVKKQRYSWHGVDYMYHGQMDFDEFYKKYCETLLALDESIGEILDYLEDEDLMDNTIVMYMGDNGFSFGEHGLIDKRQAYEESMRVPLLAMGAGIEGGVKVIKENVQNIDIGPTFLEMAGVEIPEHFDGQSFTQLMKGNSTEWRDTIYYEYFWERPFPQTPTVHAIRTAKYKYIRYHGIWDLNELFDIENDPLEMNNLIRDPEYADEAKSLRTALFEWIVKTDGDKMYLRPDGKGARFDHGYKKTF